MHCIIVTSGCNLLLQHAGEKYATCGSMWVVAGIAAMARRRFRAAPLTHGALQHLLQHAAVQHGVLVAPTLHERMVARMLERVRDARDGGGAVMPPTQSRARRQRRSQRSSVAQPQQTD
jgi:hypothetical protein